MDGNRCKDNNRKHSELESALESKFHPISGAAKPVPLIEAIHPSLKKFSQPGVVLVRVVGKVCKDKQEKRQRVLILSNSGIYVCHFGGTVNRFIVFPLVSRVVFFEYLLLIRCVGQPDLVFDFGQRSDLNSSHEMNPVLVVLHGLCNRHAGAMYRLEQCQDKSDLLEKAVMSLPVREAETGPADRVESPSGSSAPFAVAEQQQKQAMKAKPHKNKKSDYILQSTQALKEVMSQRTNMEVTRRDQLRRDGESELQYRQLLREEFPEMLPEEFERAVRDNVGKMREAVAALRISQYRRRIVEMEKQSENQLQEVDEECEHRVLASFPIATQEGNSEADTPSSECRAVGETREKTDSCLDNSRDDEPCHASVPVGREVLCMEESPSPRLVEVEFPTAESNNEVVAPPPRLRTPRVPATAAIIFASNEPHFDEIDDPVSTKRQGVRFDVEDDTNVEKSVAQGSVSERGSRNAAAPLSSLVAAGKLLQEQKQNAIAAAKERDERLQQLRSKISRRKLAGGPLAESLPSNIEQQSVYRSRGQIISEVRAVQSSSHMDQPKETKVHSGNTPMQGENAPGLGWSLGMRHVFPPPTNTELPFAHPVLDPLGLRREEFECEMHEPSSPPRSDSPSPLRREEVEVESCAILPSPEIRSLIRETNTTERASSGCSVPDRAGNRTRSIIRPPSSFQGFPIPNVEEIYNYTSAGMTEREALLFPPRRPLSSVLDDRQTEQEQVRTESVTSASLFTQSKATSFSLLHAPGSPPVVSHASEHDHVARSLVIPMQGLEDRCEAQHRAPSSVSSIILTPEVSAPMKREDSRSFSLPESFVAEGLSSFTGRATEDGHLQDRMVELQLVEPIFPAWHPQHRDLDAHRLRRIALEGVVPTEVSCNEGFLEDLVAFTDSLSAVGLLSPLLALAGNCADEELELSIGQNAAPTAVNPLVFTCFWALWREEHPWRVLVTVEPISIGFVELADTVDPLEFYVGIEFFAFLHSNRRFTSDATTSVGFVDEEHAFRVIVHVEGEEQDPTRFQWLLAEWNSIVREWNSCRNLVDE